MKKPLLFIFIFVSINALFSQDPQHDLSIMSNNGYFMLKHNKDSIYYGVNNSDSTIIVERIYLRIDKDIYLSFNSDSTFAVGQFKRCNSIFRNGKYICMEKKRFWKQFDIKGQNWISVDNYLDYQYRYIRIFPFITIVLRK